MDAYPGAPTPPVSPLPPLTTDERRQSLEEVFETHDSSTPLNLFAYGALMWWPVTAHLPATKAVLQSYRRSMCIWSVEARGAPGNPGLGLGLEAMPGTQCSGLCLTFEPPFDRHRKLLERIWEREMWTGIYRPRLVELDCEGEARSGIAFVVDSGHAQYAGGLSEAQQAEYIRNAHGKLGPCIEYLSQTTTALSEYGMDDKSLENLLTAALRR